MTPLARARLQEYLAALAIIILAMAIGAFLFCCAEAGERTPRYGILVRSEVPVNMEALDKAWEDAKDCWSVLLKRPLNTSPPAVRIVHEGLEKFGRECSYFFAVGQWVAGTVGGREAWLAPDLCAARHEFSHWIERKETGSTGAIYTECD